MHVILPSILMSLVEDRKAHDQVGVGGRATNPVNISNYRFEFFSREHSLAGF